MTLGEALRTANQHGFHAAMRDGQQLAIWGNGSHRLIAIQPDGTFPRRDILNAVHAN